MTWNLIFKKMIGNLTKCARCSLLLFALGCPTCRFLDPWHCDELLLFFNFYQHRRPIIHLLSTILQISTDVESRIAIWQWHNPEHLIKKRCRFLWPNLCRYICFKIRLRRHFCDIWIQNLPLCQTQFSICTALLRSSSIITSPGPRRISII